MEWRLLFVGSDWERKGGQLAVAALRELRRAAPGAELTIVGATPTEAVGAGVHVAGFLDKRRSSDVAQFARLLAEADLLLVPSRADCTPLAIAEAYAYGVPVVAAAVGGIPSMLGGSPAATLMDAEAGPSDWAKAISAVLADRAAYRRAALAAREEHVNRLDWDVACVRVLEIVEALRDGRTSRSAVP
jgi:glycosyltransferase involved in cell wall biosynthesis